MNRAGTWPINTRLSLVTGGSVAVLCLLFSAVLLFALHRLNTHNLIREATVAGDLIAYRLDRGEVGNPLPSIPPSLIRPIQVVDPDGRVVAATADLQGKPPMARFLPKAPHRSALGVVCDHVFGPDRCEIVVAQQVYRNGTWTVYSAVPTVPFYVYPSLLALLIGGTVVATTAVVYGAHRVVRQSLKPVDAIRAQLDEIHKTTLARRVPVFVAKDEVRHLAESVNYTLDRLESAFEELRRFTADASHELRSPITAIRTQIESAMLAPEDTDLNALGRDVLRSLDRLQAIAADLRTLTRLDEGVPGERERLDLAELVAAQLNARRFTRNIVRRLESGVTVTGDRARLDQLIASLLDNAERRAESRLTVSVRWEGPVDGDPRFRAGAAVLEVLNDGAAGGRDRSGTSVQGFTRLDSAGGVSAGGAGLGLPIARQIAESHGGALVITNSPRGACFLLLLPPASPG
ncbi:ATP-binding protein [Microbispora sp. NPDC046973]|uniref:sensor histidine kinase n=1 Tax=Microbispora sp. NPDC046973 TaxID=3155022 RepID=UPI0033E886DC